MARASFQTIAFEELVQNGACSARPKSKFLIRLEPRFAALCASE